MGKSKRKRSRSRDRSLSKENRELRRKLRNLERDRDRSPWETRSGSETPAYHVSRSREREGRLSRKADSRLLRVPDLIYSEGRPSSKATSLLSFENRTRSRSRSPSLPVSLHSRYRRTSTDSRHRNDEESGRYLLDTASMTRAGPVQEEGLENIKADDSPILILHEDEEISEEIRHILGPDPNKQKKCKFNLHVAVEPIWSHTLAYGLPKEENDQLFGKYELPENCKLLSPPKINPEIGASMNTLHSARDETHLNYQIQLGKVLASLGHSINVILEEDTSIPKQVREKILASTADSGRMLCKIINEMSNKRRQFILPLINKQLKNLLENVPPGEFLFGSELSEKIQTLKTLEKVGRDIRPIQQTNHSRSQPSYSGELLRRRGGGTGKPHTITSGHQLNRGRPAHQRREMKSLRGRPSHSQRPTVHRRR
ncbi:uncharacterized protein LOC116173893 isoform X1 [Photinus pyralis]|uniref:uncharacterized protein LOC116160376 isoform X1 n=1 Tax=Photinus pyralis TaxID=7054 RepID=UPI001266EA7C|nr:uncharacterized protein LOC116160376 isoform X1 [Photinus pyralis]XP_031347491.1 uncharacterized protein LOC116173893 isoform X1 [Photinus pyralis]